MSLVQTKKPLLILLYGYPGAGKTYFSRQIAEQLKLVHVQPDRLRSEIIQDPSYSKEETEGVKQISDYMTTEFLRIGASVVFDANANRLQRRRELRDLARKYGAQPILIWLQIDIDSARVRALNKDKRKIDDKYAFVWDKSSFENAVGNMQNPNHEEYIVVSGKHHFTTQKNALLKKLLDKGLISAESLTEKLVKPHLTNLVPNMRAGRVDDSRRNIAVR